ncbi:MAG: FAD-dependent 5-carboxymethylaminomethyl-2-thiouridine(34) oxidoreductase MnmC [Ramlibacter sp.]
MSEPVEWLPDGTPRSPRFDDIYRSASGGLEQARHVFLGGCGLPAAWADRPDWRILETGFGLGLNFLATWHEWREDSRRPRLLHFASIEAWPVSAEDLVRSAKPFPQLLPLAEQLAAQWFGLTPGTHRLVFEGGQVLLTLFVGDVGDGLRQQPFATDSIFLDGFDPVRNRAMWELQVLKGVARHCRRGTRAATWSVAGDLRRALAQCGFAVEKVEGLPPKRECLVATYAPAWEPKGTPLAAERAPGTCAIVGSGLAGAAVAASLARRGWKVTVLDAASTPAAGASGLPVGLIAPNYSPDDNLLSRLSRCGVRGTFQQARTLLREGHDWQLTGTLERHLPEEPRLGAEAAAPQAPWTRVADPDAIAAAGLPHDAAAYWHEQAGWIKPAALVHAWLQQPGVTWRGHCDVRSVVRADGHWKLRDAGGAEFASAEVVVLACALGADALVRGKLGLQAVRGQVSWAREDASADLPAFPVHGDGHVIPHVPMDHGPSWFCGSTFDRGDTDLAARDADHRANLERIRRLLPDVAARLDPQFEQGRVNAWTGVRCAAVDRRPLLGEIEPGLWVSTAMGSRGLTFAALCAELLAARLHGEPLPLDRRLAAALDVARLRRHDA